MTTDQSNNNLAIARFWPRLGAFFLDCTILGAIGVAAGFFLRDEFVRLGPWGRLLGFVVALTYFGIMNSKLAGGQTLGKRLLKIEVVTSDGAPLSVLRAFVRFLPLGAPWFLNGAQFSESVLLSAWVYVLTVVVFGLGLSVVYLYFFNRRSRQSLHDFVVGSYVVSAQTSGPVATPVPWRGHFAVCIVLVTASAIVPYFTKNLAMNAPFSSLMDVSRIVTSEPWVANANTSKGKAFFSSSTNGQRTTTYLNITAYTKDPDVKNVERARKLAKLALSVYSSAKTFDVIQVTLIYGYDIGVASSWNSQNQVHSPAEWLAQ